ncbi:MAG: alpha/beta hydrolase [Candidatus Izemoplasmatales bacterium]
MKHLYLDKKSSNLIILLHGTGGDERSLLGISEYIDEKASVLALRGNIIENGMNRFFKRLKPGVLDFNSLKEETINLKIFIDEFLEKLEEKPKIFILGYSNGANILASFLKVFGSDFQGSILLHPMFPFENTESKNLVNQKIFISYGINDSMVNHQDVLKLNSLFVKNGALVSLYKYNSGHSISNEELNDLKIWYNYNKKKELLI